MLLSHLVLLVLKKTTSWMQLMYCHAVESLLPQSSECLSQNLQLSKMQADIDLVDLVFLMEWIGPMFSVQ